MLNDFNRKHLLIGFGCVFIVLATYALTIGPLFIMADSLLYADRAKNLALYGSLEQHDQRFCYPPLYSIFISPAYLLGGTLVSQIGVVVINVLLCSSVYFPLCFLLRVYSGLSPRAAIGAAIVLALFPTTLAHTPMIMSEPLYFPLVLWVAFALVRTQQTRSWGAFIGVGVGMALMLLCRSAALIVALAGAVFIGLELFANQVSEKSERGTSSLIWKAATAVALPVFLLFCWSLVESGSCESSETYSDTVARQIWPILTDSTELARRSAWLVNQISYALTSPLCVAPVFVLIVLMVRPKRLFTDPFCSFALLSLFGAAVSVLPLPPLAVDAEGMVGVPIYGENFTWGRYIIPYLSFWFLIALRYRNERSLVHWGASAAIFSLLWILDKPSDLVLHTFPDSLLFFVSHPFDMSDGIFDGIYFLWVMGVGALLMTRTPWVWKLGVTAFVFGVASTNLLTFAYWSNRDFMRSYDYTGLVAQAGTEIKAGEAPIFIDTEIDRRSFAIGRIEFHLPFFAEERSLKSLQGLNRNEHETFYYITQKQVLGREPLAFERNIYLHLLNHQQIREGQSVFYSVTPLSGAYPPEDYQIKSQPVSIRWLQKEASFRVYLEGRSGLYRFTAKLDAITAPRQLMVSVNGRSLTEQITIDKVIWQNDFNTVSLCLNLVRGDNVVQFWSNSDSVVLDPLRDHREVSFVLIGMPSLQLITSPQALEPGRPADACLPRVVGQ